MRKRELMVKWSLKCFGAGWWALGGLCSVGHSNNDKMEEHYVILKK